MPDDPTPRDLLSREELRELLAPMGADPDLTGEAEPPAVLLLSETPEDAELLTPALARRHMALVAVAHRFRALDRFRQRRFVGVVAALECLEDESAHFFQRLRELDPQIRLVFLCDAAAGGSPAATRLRAEGPVLVRPLGEHAVAEVVSSLCDDLPADPRAGGAVATGGAVAVASPAAVEVASVAPAEQPPRPLDPDPLPAQPAAAAPQPDPLLALESLLEARIEGGGLRTGLGLWQQRDPAVGGLVELSDDASAGLGVHAHGASRSDSLRMLREALEILETPDASPASADEDEPLLLRHGRLLRFANDDDGGPGLAIWQSSDPGRDEDLARRLAPGLRLLQRLQLGAAVDRSHGGTPREWFLEVLRARMQACARHHDRLAVVLAEEADARGAEVRMHDLQTCLRGGDLAVLAAQHVWMLLDRPARGWSAALSARLRGLAGADRLRVVGCGWSPPAADAEQLLEDVEAMLAEHPGTPLVNLAESPRS